MFGILIVHCRASQVFIVVASFAGRGTLAHEE